MFSIVNKKKSLIKPECSVTQSLVMMHQYKYAIAEVLSGKNIFGTVNPSYDGQRILFDMIMV